MTTRTVTAMFNSRADAERAVERLVSDLGLQRSMVRINPEPGAADTGYSQAQPVHETGFWASLKELFVPDEDRYAYAEGIRRGSVLVSATVDEGQVERASDILEHAGAVDLDQQEESWRQSGWTGYDATAATAAGAAAGAASLGARAASQSTGAGAGRAATAATASTSVQTGQDQAIPIIEERLVVGKREVDRGSVRVRSYVVERPVEEQVSLHEERVGVERRPVDRALTDMDRDPFKERVIEATATSEEAVIGKEARVVEEVMVHKDVADRTETVRDTVRRTEVEVEDGTTGARTGAAGASGTENPPGTMASRTVDKTLGTNISGANPARKP